MMTDLFKAQPIKGMRIGLFGGSFNPVHKGHFALAKCALTRLQLDYVWWMVSPQNPLKPRHETSDFNQRLAQVRQIARHPRFVVTDIESRLQTTTTAQTLKKLQPVFDQAHFVWLMGADSFAGLHHWNDWQAIPQNLPIAVFDRPGWTTKSLACTAAKCLKPRQFSNEKIALLPFANTPAWGFVSMPQRPENSTALRSKRVSQKHALGLDPGVAPVLGSKTRVKTMA